MDRLLIHVNIFMKVDIVNESEWSCYKIRATFDGLSADIKEFCLECELQGETLKYNNGSLIEKDPYGIAKKMGLLLLDELRKLGNTFTCAYIVEKLEEEVYQSIGLEHNSGHLVYYKDERPYVRKSF